MSNDRAKWDVRFLRIAKREVADWSKDPDERVGCLVVSPDRRSWTGGYNGFPVSVHDTAHRLGDRDIKNELSVHAELNAIYNARRDLTGWTLYVTKAPCMECAKAIIQAGIARVVCPPIRGSSSWAVIQERAQSLLLEAGVNGSTILTEKFE